MPESTLQKAPTCITENPLPRILQSTSIRAHHHGPWHIRHGSTDNGSSRARRLLQHDGRAATSVLQPPGPPAGSRPRSARCGRGLGDMGTCENPQPIVWQNRIAGRSLGRRWSSGNRSRTAEAKHSTRDLFDSLPDRRGRTPEDCVYMARKPRTWRQYRPSSLLAVGTR